MGEVGMADTYEAVSRYSESEIDLRAILRALKRRRSTYIVPTIIAFILVGIYVNVVTKRYTAQAQLLLENQETFFTRPDRVSAPADQNSQLDEAAVSSQVQLIMSPDLARRAIQQIGLVGNPEFDPRVHFNPLTRVLVALGIMPDPARSNDGYFDRFDHRRNEYHGRGFLSPVMPSCFKPLSHYRITTGLFRFFCKF